VIAKMSTSEYFNFLAEAMKENPPVLPQDAPILAEMARIGIVPGEPLNMSQLSPGIQKALENVPQTVNAQFISMESRGVGEAINGWQIPGVCGNYGTDYRIRAAISAFGWGCNLPEDAVYPTTKVDGAGNPLSGTNTYVIHFNKGETPPVQGFWSITMYDKQYYFYPNPLDKLTVSPRNKFKYNADGSLDLYFSHMQPAGVEESNWLPAPADKFRTLHATILAQKAPPSILPPSNPSWTPPPVKMAE
jgi:hypothetical protein